MDPKHARRQATARDLFGVTPRPYLPSYTGLETLAAAATNGFIRETGPVMHVALEGQEFLLFRGLSSESAVDSFAATYGVLGVSHAAAEQVRVKPNLRPAWARALTLAPDRYRRGAEPVDDWLRQAGLMDMALGLWGLTVSPPSRRALVSACRKLGSGTKAGHLARQAELAGSSSSWPVRSVLGGAAVAGLRARAASLWTQGAGSRTEIEFYPPSWRKYRRAGREIRLVLRLELTTAGVFELIVRLIDPWLGRVRASLMVEQSRIIPSYVLPRDLIGILWIQFANALVSSIDPRICAWERCPGPPERPGVFLWRWGQTAGGTKHRDAMYCHPRCQHAAAVDRSRKSPGSLQHRRR